MPNMTVTIEVHALALEKVLALAEQTLRTQGIDDTDESRDAWNAHTHVTEALLEAGLEQ